MHPLNLPWTAEKEMMGWAIRDCNGKLIFIPQDLNCEAEKEYCLLVCVSVNNAFAYMIDKK